VGMRAPTAVKRSGFFRNSTTSMKSCLASSMPATSAKVTPVLGSMANLALDFPNASGLLPPPPPCWERRERMKRPATRMRGKARLASRPKMTVEGSSWGLVRSKVDLLLAEALQELGAGPRELHAHALDPVAELGGHGLYNRDGSVLVQIHLLHAVHVEVLEEARGRTCAAQASGLVRSQGFAQEERRGAHCGGAQGKLQELPLVAARRGLILRALLLLGADLQARSELHAQRL